MFDIIGVGIIVAAAAAFLVYRYGVRKDGGCSCGTGACGSGKKHGSCGCHGK